MTLEYNAMAANICNQIVALQTAIASREENTNIPTMQEVTMQVRLLGCLDKLQKFAAREEKAARADGRVQLRTLAPSLPSDPPPFSEQEAQNISDTLVVNNAQELDEPYELQGKTVWKAWMIYNLLQYCYTEDKRCFIADEQQLRQRHTIHDIFDMVLKAQVKKAA